MPASVYDPISSVLKNSFHGPGAASKAGLADRMEGGLQKSMLMTVHYDDPVKQSPTISPSQKSKYTILNPSSKPDSSKGSDDGGSVTSPSAGSFKLDQVPDPKQTLFRRDQVELGYRGPTGPGAGMHNMGNTCYLNSTLQALFHTPAFVNYLKYGGHENNCGLNGFSCTICIMSATLKSTANTNVMRPQKIYEKLKMICKHLTHGRQEDAHEFLRYLVESLQKCYLISRKVPKTIDNYTKETTPFNQIFGGYMRQDVVCLKCRHISTTFQHFMDLLLDIRQADNIDSALGVYFRRENLGQGENMYKCEKCKQKVPATKQYKIERPPMVLCIQLKRFNLMGGKNGRPVTLARKLSLTNHVRWAPAKSIAVEYKLVSMINHVGPSPNCGHYTSIGEAGNGTFYRFDDSAVHPTSLQNALNTSAYVIFYEMLPRTKTAIMSPRPGKTEQQSPSSKSVQQGCNSKLASKNPQNSPKLIGPLLPPSSPAVPNRPLLISEPSKTPKPSTPLPSPKPKLISEPSKTPKPSTPLPSPKPKLISEPSKTKQSPSPAVSNVKPQQLKAGLVPYGNDSSSDDEAVVPVKSPKPLANQAPSSHPTLISTKPPQDHSSSPSSLQPKSLSPKPSASPIPVTNGESKTVPAIASPFLPRSVAVNFKKIKDTVKNEIPVVLKSANAALVGDLTKLTEVNKGQSLSELKQQEKPNRDPSAEALYSNLSPETPRAFSPPSLAKSNSQKSSDLKTVAPSTPQSKNEFTVTDVDSHNPSIHSDNSAGSTASFTVTELSSGSSIRTNTDTKNISTSRQKWNITPSSSSTSSSSSKTMPSTSSLKVNGTTPSTKRERSVPPKLTSFSKVMAESEKDKEEALSDTELMGSPKKRKKVGVGSGLLVEKPNLFEKAAEIGKDVWNAGTKLGLNLFKSSKTGPKSDQDFEGAKGEYESESVTACEATTSYQGEKAISSTSALKELDAEEDINEDFRNPKKHKKKKKKKHKERDVDEWEEKTKDNLDKYNQSSTESSKLKSSKDVQFNEVKKTVKESTSNPLAPVKKWDSKPELKTIGRSVTWDGSKGSSVFQELLKGTEIRSWSGDRGTLEKNQEVRKRSAESDPDEEMDRGRTKKVKKRQEEPKAYKWDQNPFQIGQNIINRGENLHDSFKTQDARRSGDFHRSDSRDGSSKRGYNQHEHFKRDRYNDQHKHHRDHHKDRYQSSHHRHDRHGGHSRYSKDDRR